MPARPPTGGWPPGPWQIGLVPLDGVLQAAVERLIALDDAGGPIRDAEGRCVRRRVDRRGETVVARASALSPFEHVEPMPVLLATVRLAATPDALSLLVAFADEAARREHAVVGMKDALAVVRRFLGRQPAPEDAWGSRVFGPEFGEGTLTTPPLAVGLLSALAAEPKPELDVLDVVARLLTGPQDIVRFGHDQGTDIRGLRAALEDRREWQLLASLVAEAAPSPE